MNRITSAEYPATGTVHVSDWENARRLTAGTSLVASPLLLTAAFLVVPTTANNPATVLNVIAAHSTRWYLFGLFLLLSYLLLVPATLGLIHLTHHRSPAWGNVGGSLAILGAITAVSDTRLWVFAQQQMADPDADRAQMLALLARLEGAAGASLPFILGALALLTGTVMLAVGLYRARAVAAWVCAALAAGIVASFAAWFAGSQPALVATSLLLAVGYGGVGVGFVRQSVAAWQRGDGVH